MSLVLADRVRETTTSTGTGTITLGGAVTGFQSFAVIGNNNTTYYTIAGGSQWEVGLGTYYGGTLSRDTVLASSTGSVINLSAGSKDVFVCYPAEKSVNEDANNRVLIPYTTGTTNVGSLNVGNATAHTDSGVIAGFTASEPLYLYTSLQNTSTANTSYASYAVNDGGHTAYGELGINNSNYSYLAAGFPNNGFSTPLATFVESYGGPLVLGSWDNQKISMIINGAVSTTDAMTINTNGSVAFNGQVGTAGQVLQSNATSAPTWVTPNAGTVTSVSGTTGRITSTGGATPVLDLASGVATAGTTGSSTLIPVITIDTYGRVTSITTASNPQGTVTSVSALTLGTTGTDLSSTVSNSTTTPVITLNVPTASATNRGVLSSADWTTFNNKGSGTVTSVTATSPVASSGGATPAISLSSGYGDTQNPYASKTANYFLAAPNGLAGAPTFRAVVAADIPTLNQNTTGTASNVTGTVAIANGGTGATDATNARSNLSAAKSGANTDITSIALTTGTISTAPSGGTDIVNKTYADGLAAKWGT